MHSGIEHNCVYQLDNVYASQSCPRVGWTRGSGRVGSRFCRILAGRVGSGRVSTSDFLVFY